MIAMTPDELWIALVTAWENYENAPSEQTVRALLEANNPGALKPHERLTYSNPAAASQAAAARAKPRVLKPGARGRSKRGPVRQRGPKKFGTTERRPLRLGAVCHQPVGQGSEHRSGEGTFERDGKHRDGFKRSSEGRHAGTPP